MKRISRNLTAAALASSLALAGATAANAEENTTVNPDGITTTDTENGGGEAGNTDTENGGTEGGGEAGVGETGGDDEANPGKDNEENPVPGEGENGDDETTTNPGEGENTPGDGKKPEEGTNPGDGKNPDDGTNPGDGKNPDDGKKPEENKEKSSFDDIKAKLSSEEGKPTDLGIAAIVLGVLGAIAAAVPAAAQALNIKLPF